jgi:hypothetical protein
VTSFDQSLEMSNELSRLIHDRHRVKLGVLLHVARSAQELSPVKFGSYSASSR